MCLEGKAIEGRETFTSTKGSESLEARKPHIESNIMVHSNNVSTMPAYDQKNRSRSQKTNLEKILFVFVFVLFAVVALLLCLYLIRIQKEVGIHRREKTNDGSKTCTKQSCVFNAASK